MTCDLLTYAAEDASSASEAPATDDAHSPLVLKMMIVNPSDKFKQIYPMKAYLPEEVLPDHILSRDDLELGYDAEKKAYYVTKEIELDPGQSVVKAITISDVWLIPEHEMKTLSEEAHSLFDKLKHTKFEDKGKLLLNNVEVLLTQIFERQNDTMVTPEEHISIYRDNRGKIRDIELDLVALRRLVASTGETGLIGRSLDGGMAVIGKWDKEMTDKAKGGAIPAWVAWRIIFGILVFLGVISLVSYWTWQHQLRLIEKRRKPKEEEPINLDELFGKSDLPTTPASPSHPTIETLPPGDQHDQAA